MCIRDRDVDAAAYGEDWDGFKELVEKSDIKDKNLILQVLSLYNSSCLLYTSRCV